MTAPLVYLDTSAALAHLLNEDIVPPERLWREALVSSRLLEYEGWRRLHAMGLAESHGDFLRNLLAGVAMLDLAEPIVGHARDASAGSLRTLDALHLAAMLFLRDQGQSVQLATYDARLRRAAVATGVPLYEMV